MQNHVNASGFPLQIAIQHIVDEFQHLHSFSTVFSEHSWKNDNTGESGFIDLVVSSRSKGLCLVVECKRVKDTSWIFMRDMRSPKTSRRTKSFIYRRSTGTEGRFGWADLTMHPLTPESIYCVIPGTDTRSKSLIERSASELVSSTEALATEYKSLSLEDREVYKVFSNVIVTTAKLNVCEYDASKISLEDGSLKESNFEEVPYIRFRKQLSPLYQIPDVYKVAGDGDVARAKENTVFVVNALNFHKFLNEIYLDNSNSNSQYLR